jgi:cytochrome c553
VLYYLGIEELETRDAAIAATMCWLVAVPCVAFADRVSGEEKAESCLLCHGAFAKEGKHYVPILDGQPPAYLMAQLTAYKTGKRTETAMKTSAAGLSADDLKDLADYFVSRKSGPYPDFDFERASAGMKTLSQLPCTTCHGLDYSGNGSAARLAGQNPRYTASELRSMRSGKRLHPTGVGADSIRALMDDELNNVAHALASLN